ncbi:MAG TPA: molybdopterin oxidoreductase family protein [Euzebya sp.]|nr:molybdopterin oxidoreductase family protein [Euzebya sp.]
MSTSVTTHCPYCALDCGLKLTVEAGTVTGSTKWKGSPLTGGGLCTKGITAWQQVNHVDRLTTPLVRRSGVLTPAGWDEALDLAAEGFLRLRDEHGPAVNAVLGGGSLTNEKAYLVGKLARLGLQTPHVDPNGRLCMTSAGAAAVKAFGIDRAMTPLGHLPDADVVVVVGANLADAFPLIMPLVAKARRKGTRFIVVDPRGSKLIKPGDVHLAVRPGTDTALAAGLLHEIAVAGGVDWPFVRDRTTGADDALQAVEGWDLDRTALACGVPVTDLATAAGWMSRARNGMILHARGIEQQVNGVQAVLSWINIALARGWAGRKGCGIMPMTGQRNGQGGREHGQRCDQLPGYRSIEDPAHRAVVARRWGVRPEDLPGRGRTYVELLHDAGEGTVKGMLVISANPVVSAPRGDRIRDAVSQLEHLVVIDPFLSETARYASVVLPGTTFAEEDGTVTTTEGRVVRVDQAVPPLAVRGDLDIIRGLASRLGVRDKFDFHTGREVFEELKQLSAGGVADYSGIDFDRLREDGGVFWPAPADRPEGTPLLHVDRFAHPDGLARMVPVTPSGPHVLPDATYPLVLTTGRHRDHYLSGNQTRRIPAQAQRAPGPVLEVHPDTAVACNLVEGDPVRVTSRQATIELPWTTNQALRPDTLFVAWHWEGINDLTDDALDPISKIAAVKHTPVTIAACRPLLPQVPLAVGAHA